MSDNEKRTKPKYEAPTVVALGELARGAGANCAMGSGANPGYCEAGTSASPGYCTAGTIVATACTAGTTPGA